MRRHFEAAHMPPIPLPFATTGEPASACGGIPAEPVVIGHILEWTHSNWNLTFYVSAGVYLTGVIFWMLLDPVTPIER